MNIEKNNSVGSNLIDVKNLTKVYGRFRAVDNISISVKKGELIGFLGLNGAGKSTTMDMLTGCLDATSGSIEIGGYDIQKHPVEAKKLIGYLPDVPPLYGDMTVQEYLSFVCDLKRVKNSKKEIDKVVEKTVLGDKLKKIISTLSKGYRQRVGLAQALVGDPSVLILDEPTSGLDPSQVVLVRGLFKKLAKDHTIILSTHILPEVENICDRILIINKGKIVANEQRKDMLTKNSLLYSLQVKCKNLVDVESAVKSANENFKVKNLVQFSDEIVEFDLEISDLNPNIDIYLMVSKALIARDIAVLQFKNVSQSLEKTFLSLVGTVDLVDENSKKVKKGVEI